MLAQFRRFFERTGLASATCMMVSAPKFALA
jgi:hypothetical protein